MEVEERRTSIMYSGFHSDISETVNANCLPAQWSVRWLNREISIEIHHHQKNKNDEEMSANGNQK